ncbi:MAG: Gfo/Idh/MocA family oxidoreductase [Candidatus Omnitrophica bacterium]|nr:Gfo/Idh/MocA family oxidoreductase [Candidatus Omnitrophota bacterium]MBI2174573.1 Gfo/Idh/MocA family oxidoreductase [Candidatus Omnitrophota bacterium]
MPVRIALIGCGKVTERIALPQLATCQDAQVASLVDIDRSAAIEMADKLKIDRRRVWTDWKQMLRDAEVDAVAVNLPNALHAEVAVAALEARKHVLVEKPIATTLADADAMIRASRIYKKVLMVDQTQRFHPVHELAHELLGQGKLGKVGDLSGRLGHAGPEYWSGKRKSWLVDPVQSGGGALMDVGIHILDLLRWLSGKEVRRVCCQTKTLEKQVPVEDNAKVLLEFTDGAIGSFEASWTARPYEVTTRFYGREGTLCTTLDAPRPLVIRYAKQDEDPNHLKGEEDPSIPSASRRGGAYSCFIQCVQEGKAAAVSGEDARASLEVILAAYASVKSGGWIELPQ